MHTWSEGTSSLRKTRTSQRLRGYDTDVGFRLINTGFVIEFAVRRWVGRKVSTSRQTQHRKISKKNILAIIQYCGIHRHLSAITYPLESWQQVLLYTCTEELYLVWRDYRRLPTYKDRKGFVSRLKKNIPDRNGEYLYGGQGRYAAKHESTPMIKTGTTWPENLVEFRMETLSEKLS